MILNALVHFLVSSCVARCERATCFGGAVTKLYQAVRGFIEYPAYIVSRVRAGEKGMLKLYHILSMMITPVLIRDVKAVN